MAQYRIIVVGAGGTGTYYLKEISRFLRGRKDLSACYVIDGDTIEDKNLSRQSFLPEDIGRNKAVVMSEILGDNFGVTWRAVPQYISRVEDLIKLCGKYVFHEITILVGCCDNHACRKVMEDFFHSTENCIYLDAANEYKAGQIVVAAKKGDSYLGKPRSFYFPDLFEGDMRSVEEMSCEELNNSSPQHIFTNMFAGQLLGLFTAQILEENSLECGICYFDNTAGIHSMEFVSYQQVATKENAGVA